MFISESNLKSVFSGKDKIVVKLSFRLIREFSQVPFKDVSIDDDNVAFFIEEIFHLQVLVADFSIGDWSIYGIE
ncbi:MAG: hypothetical protein OFPI_42100 [Osedax symbiont Rs2]|nr:MAG: hypothetical protein OFPI_42100 [Osedax symbiont Rs2]